VNEIILSDFRNVRSPRDGRARSLYFTPSESGTATISIEATGLASSEDVAVKSASGSQVLNGRIRRHFNANERTRIDIEFAEPYSGPIELRVSVEPDGVPANENH
jgi:hypothetical protein